MPFTSFSEIINKVSIKEFIDKNGKKYEKLTINDKWQLIPTGNKKKPFKKEKIKN